jgi:hypothetical protein
MNLRACARSAASRLKSHGVPRLIGGACRRIATHVVRLPRLTLKAGSKAGSPPDSRLEMWAYVVVALWQILLGGLRALPMWYRHSAGRCSAYPGGN